MTILQFVRVFGHYALALTAQNLELLAEDYVLENQRFAIAERPSEQVQDETQHPGRLAAGRL